MISAGTHLFFGIRGIKFITYPFAKPSASSGIFTASSIGKNSRSCMFIRKEPSFGTCYWRRVLEFILFSELFTIAFFFRHTYDGNDSGKEQFPGAFVVVSIPLLVILFLRRRRQGLGTTVF